jgi:small subunit ribosomal protein S16
VVTDIRNPRDGKYLEMVGWYNPFNEQQPCQVDAGRIQYWLSQGATLSPNAQAVLVKAAPEVARSVVAQKHNRTVKAAAKRRALRKA